MSKRQNIITFDSTEVQGEGSWIKVRMVTHGQSKKLQKDFSDVIGKDFSDISIERRAEFQTQSDELLTRMIVDWNWVNDDDEPLPLPRDEQTVVDELTELEHQFIANAIRGEGERKK